MKKKKNVLKSRNYIDDKNRLLECKRCGKIFCETCEGWIDKVEEYRGKTVQMKYPLCEERYGDELEKRKERIDRKIQEEEKTRECPICEHLNPPDAERCEECGLERDLMKYDSK